ncbi:hypothetical protein [Brevibacterium marinum]|uniref:Uncharacterized protein n=1 Tax=Brevibacterium marinum TaxID=418643 RepID=A0A846RW23_9MICO|nr:hypothetical protein [Brevibacterium marinum]NJC55108.1 hypothetical protein [Brevibacterium marinum]
MIDQYRHLALGVANDPDDRRGGRPSRSAAREARALLGAAVRSLADAGSVDAGGVVAGGAVADGVGCAAG